MGVVSVKKLWTKRGGTDTFEHRRTYTREYEVVTDDPDDGEAVVGNDPDIPVRGTVADFDDQAYVISVDPQQSDDSPYIWYVTIEYDSEPPLKQAVDLDGNTTDPADVPEDPLDEPAKWKLTTQDSEEPAVDGIAVLDDGSLDISVPAFWTSTTVYKKGKYVQNGPNVYFCATAGTSAGAGGPAGQGSGIVDGGVRWDFYATLGDTQNDPTRAIRVAIVNSAGLPFDPPPMVEVSRAVYSVTVNVPVVTVESLLKLKNAVNVIPWKGFPARTVKVLKIEHDGGAIKNGVPFVASTWEIGIDPDTWDLRILDAGFSVKQLRTPEGGGAQVPEWIQINDVNGNPITEPVPLNGAGGRLAPEDDPVFLRFVPRQIRLVDFNEELPF